MKNKADVIIVGGGIIGSSVAYHLLADGFAGRIIVFEKDPSYAYASTPRSWAASGSFLQRRSIFK